MEKIITIINRVGTKKHQLNGVEYTSTAIGIELIGNFAVNSPHPFLIFLLHNTPISSISQIHSELGYKNNSSIVWMKMAYPSHHSYNQYNPQHHIPHQISSMVYSLPSTSLMNFHCLLGNISLCKSLLNLHTMNVVTNQNIISIIIPYPLTISLPCLISLLRFVPLPYRL